MGNTKQLHVFSKRQTAEIVHEKIWIWLRKGILKREDGSILIAVINNVKKTNYIQAKINNMQQNSKCKLCEEKDEMVESKLAPKTARLDSAAGNCARDLDFIILPNGKYTNQNPF